MSILVVIYWCVKIINLRWLWTIAFLTKRFICNFPFLILYSKHITIIFPAISPRNSMNVGKFVFDFSSNSTNVRFKEMQLQKIETQWNSYVILMLDLRWTLLNLQNPGGLIRNSISRLINQIMDMMTCILMTLNCSKMWENNYIFC